MARQYTPDTVAGLHLAAAPSTCSVSRPPPGPRSMLHGTISLPPSQDLGLWAVGTDNEWRVSLHDELQAAAQSYLRPWTLLLNPARVCGRWRGLMALPTPTYGRKARGGAKTSLGPPGHQPGSTVKAGSTVHTNKGLASRSTYSWA
jgi:hypothetical protein